MKTINTKFKGLKILRHTSFKDERGFLRITHNQNKLKKKFIFEYCTTSKKHSLRGFHFQYKYQQAKYVSVLKGKILDCVIDLRKNSDTFGEIFKIILSEKNKVALFIPRGFAHAYYSYEKENIIYYKLDNYYHSKFEGGIYTLDKKLNISWPKKRYLISKKDKSLNNFETFKKKYKYL
jgi:dTDP-4-dehydrorhamnose 3,5-epimerase